MMVRVNGLKPFNTYDGGWVLLWLLWERGERYLPATWLREREELLNYILNESGPRNEFLF